MRYDIGDKVKIKSLEWYNSNKDHNKFVHCGVQVFIEKMSKFCGQTLTVLDIYDDCYLLGNGFLWTDEMIEDNTQDTSKNIEDELINYVLELVDGNDYICDELMSDAQENKYCENNCKNLCEECVIRFINKRIKDKSTN